LLAGGNSDWNITGNSFYQTATRSTTGTVNAFQSSSTLNNNLNVSNNFIGGSQPNAGGAPMTYIGGTIYRGFQISTTNSTFSNFNNNTFQNISVTSTSTSSAQSLISILNGRINCNNNTIGSQTTNNNVVFSLSGSAARLQAIIAGTGATPELTNINGNTIGGMALQVTGAPATVPAFFPISVQGTTAGQNFTVNNNVIGSATTANSVTSDANGSLVGIISFAGAVGQTYNNNLIANLSATNAGTGGTAAGMNLQGAGSSPNFTGSFTATGNTVRNITTQSSAAFVSAYGIQVSGTVETNAGQVVTNNTIHSVSNTSASAVASIAGMLVSLPSANLNTIAGNNIHSLSLSSSNTTAAMRGMILNGGRNLVANNFIRLGINPDGSNITTSYLMQGILENTGVIGNIYHNSVYIGGAGVNTGASNSFAFSSASTTAGRDYRNNIFVNARSNAAGTGKHYAMTITGAAPNQAGLISEYNLLSATGTGGFTGLFNAADQTTLDNWRTATGFDFNSITGDPQFINPAGPVASVDLHISATNTTPVEAAGANAGVANDVDGQVRAGLSPVDIGADAGNFNGTDISGPGIGYTPIANLCGTGDINLNNVNITDATGIPLSGSLRPRVYYRKGAGAWFSQAGTLVSGTAQNSIWNFTIVAADMGGLASNDVVQYYVIAQDLSATPRIASYAGGVVATDVNNVTTHPATAFTVTLPNTLVGTYTVGSGGNFPTLTAAVTAYNTSCLAGPVVFSLTDATYPSETFPITINANTFANSTNTLTIRPAAGNTATIAGASATGSALIRLNGADWVTINGSNAGGTDRNLTINNSSTLTNVAAIWVSSVSIANGATNNSIRNCNIVGGSNTVSSVFGIHVSGQTISTSATGENNDNLTLQNNNINTAYYGIYARAASVAGGNDGLQIIGNSIGSDNSANYVIFR
ncbi:MAG: beta strand repeat-containing protein, partial [Saprospiraceae bacterium]